MAKKLYELTNEHRAQLKPHADKWITNAMSTKPMDDAECEVCRQSVIGLYAAANLPAPKHIVFVPSPFIMRFSAGFAAAIWYLNHNPGKLPATEAATRAATRAARAATWDATITFREYTIKDGQRWQTLGHKVFSRAEIGAMIPASAPAPEPAPVAPVDDERRAEFLRWIKSDAVWDTTQKQVNFYASEHGHSPGAWFSRKEVAALVEAAPVLSELSEGEKALRDAQIELAEAYEAWRLECATTGNGGPYFKQIDTAYEAVRALRLQAVEPTPPTPAEIAQRLLDVPFNERTIDDTQEGRKCLSLLANSPDLLEHAGRLVPSERFGGNNCEQ